jgi:hypothetical protein
MATSALLPNPETETPEEVSVDNPQSAQDAERQKTLQKEEQDEEAALILCKNTAKQSWTTKRQALIRRVLKAIMYVKGDPYSVMNYGANEMNPISQVLSGSTQADDPKLYAYNDNMVQMLCLSFIAALVPDVPKVRWAPGDPDDEGDLSFSKKASTLMAEIERKNDMPTLQVAKLFYLWVAGTYFCYARNVVDAVRGGTTKTPVMAMKPMEMLPNRYVCPDCGSPNPENQMHPLSAKQCLDCGAPLDDSHFYPSESMDVPVQIGENETANSFTAIDIYCVLNVDVDPDASDLSKSPILDLEGEMDVASVRACYPERYAEITGGQYGDNSVNNPQARLAREAVTSPTVERTMTNLNTKSTYSRCWIQAWQFNSLDDEEMAKRLTKKYPKGCKLVTWGDLVLEKRPEAMHDHWGEGRTIKTLGMNPFGVGDVALNVQDRVDNNANNIEAYQDKLALPPVLANANLIDAASLSRAAWGGGRVIPVYPSTKTPGQKYDMSQALWQPTFHADAKIYDYSTILMTLMQLLTGVQPQIFGGGTTKGVDTFGGQEQMLNTAMGRLMLFLLAVRSENAITATLAVACMASDIDDKKRITVPGAVEGEYENEYILQSEVQGQIQGYPQADQGFPASYGEMRDRIIQLLGMVEKNPVLQNILSSPDSQKTISRYILPEGVKLPDEDERSKVKLILQQLAQAEPIMIEGQPMPSIQPDPDCDTMGMIVELAKNWMNKNYKLATTQPKGYANVRAYLKIAAQADQLAQAKQAALQAAAGPSQGAPGGGGDGA